MVPYFFTEVKCKENTQIIHMEETEKCHRVIRLLILQLARMPVLIWVDAASCFSGSHVWNMTRLKGPKGTLLPTWSSQYVNTVTIGISYMLLIYSFQQTSNYSKKIVKYHAVKINPLEDGLNRTSSLSNGHESKN